MTKLNCGAKTEQKRNLAALQVWESQTFQQERTMSPSLTFIIIRIISILKIEMNEVNL